MTRILDGREVGQSIRRQISEDAKALREQGVVPKLAIFRVGDEESSVSYEQNAVQAMTSCGIEVERVTFPANATNAELLEEMHRLNQEETIHGIILMHPLPGGVSKKRLAEAIDPRKDVDGLHPLNLGRLMAGDVSALMPSTPLAVLEILRFYDITLEGTDIVVIGSSSTVGKPLSVLLSNLDATVSNLHIHTKDLNMYTKKADILISATGQLGLIDASLVKKGAVVIDVGYGYQDGEVMGDVDYADVFPVASAITPVPGGVGSVTTSVLAAQLVKAAKILSSDYKMNERD